MTLMKQKNLLCISLLTGLTLISDDIRASESKRDYFALSLEELANIKVITSSRREQSIDDSYANIMVVTKEMIERRGYRNIIEILEDLPGFDLQLMKMAAVNTRCISSTAVSAATMATHASSSWWMA